MCMLDDHPLWCKIWESGSYRFIIHQVQQLNVVGWLSYKGKCELNSRQEHLALRVLRSCIWWLGSAFVQVNSALGEWCGFCRAKAVIIWAGGTCLLVLFVFCCWKSLSVVVFSFYNIFSCVRYWHKMRWKEKCNDELFTIVLWGSLF